MSKALLGMEAICVTFPGVRGETFCLSCVILNKKPKSGCCSQPWQMLGLCVGHSELFSLNVI